MQRSSRKKKERKIEISSYTLLRIREPRRMEKSVPLLKERAARTFHLKRYRVTRPRIAKETAVDVVDNSALDMNVGRGNEQGNTCRWVEEYLKSDDAVQFLAH